MTLSELITKLQAIQKEVQCDGKQIASHKIQSSVSLSSDDPDDDNAYEITSIEPSRLLGCGCWDGVTINFRKKD